MRRLAAELGVQPTAISWHVPNRAALVEAILERVVHEATVRENCARSTVTRLERAATRFAGRCWTGPVISTNRSVRTASTRVPNVVRR